ncbi:hypothetical protein ACFV0R_32480 [Streptomyces sp. NPDC059578]|uniref:hypothetical protein n=1 Tax=Streptomyces sp. NPDC059578 TaxID=3346874 RepID=UPI0036CDF47C
MHVLTGGVSASPELTGAVRELVWGQLGRSALGASALARLHEQPGEGSASIVGSVLADELRADPRFAERLRNALEPLSNSPAHDASQGIPTAPPPPVLPPRPTASVPPAAPEPVEVWKAWLLGVPQFLLAYVVLSVTSRLFWSPALQIVIVVASTGLTAYGVRLVYRLLRRARSTSLVVAMVLNVLVLLIWVRGLLGLIGA